MRALIVAAAIFALGSTAHAEKKRNTATLLSGLGTGVSSALVLSSFLAGDTYNPVNQPLLYTGLGTSIITPSLGEWYAGEWLSIGMAVRIGAVGLATFAVAHEQHDVTCDLPTDHGCKAFYGVGIALLGLAGIAYIGGAAYDVQDAANAVDRYNRRHSVYAARRPTRAKLALAPTALAGPRGELVPGVYFSATY